MTRAEWQLDHGMPMFEVKSANDEQEFYRSLALHRQYMIHSALFVFPPEEGNRMLSYVLHQLATR